jgi:DNA-binding transcriptional LysR family regulator
VVLPPLARFLAETAPHISLDVRDITSDTPEALEAGDIDLAFGFMTLRKQGLFHQGLFSERFCCLVRNDHPVVRTRFTLQMLQTVAIVQVAGTGNSFPLLASSLGRARVTPKVAILMPDGNPTCCPHSRKNGTGAGCRQTASCFAATYKDGNLYGQPALASP